MKPIVFVLVDAGGNVPPARAIAAELVRKGQSVHVLGQARQQAGFEEIGCRFTALASVGFWDNRQPSSLLPALWRAVRLASDRAIGDEVEATLREISPRAVLVDCLMASAAAGAVRACVANAILFHTFLAYWRDEYARGPVGLLARMRGVSVRRTWDRADMRLVVSDRSIDPAGSDATETVTWVGPTEHGTPAIAGSEPPLVLVSLSTTWFPGQTDAYQRIIDALGTLPVRGLVTTGGLEPDFPIRVPPNVELKGRVPHGQIMPDVSLVISHGGHSTTFTALAHDLPLIILPMHPMLDQPMVGTALAKAGAAQVLPRKASYAAIAACLRALLADGQARKAAAQIGARVRKADAAPRAAMELLSLGGA
jgi:UDP:flavonoid glycosyltransferase YjiC (YdhE family)